jgi:hypothetical protein
LEKVITTKDSVEENIKRVVAENQHLKKLVQEGEERGNLSHPSTLRDRESCASATSHVTNCQGLSIKVDNGVQEEREGGVANTVGCGEIENSKSLIAESFQQFSPSNESCMSSSLTMTSSFTQPGSISGYSAVLLQPVFSNSLQFAGSSSTSFRPLHSQHADKLQVPILTNKLSSSSCASKVTSPTNG